MRESRMTDGLTMQWVPVVDADGRTQLVAHWHDASAPVSTTGGHTTHAA